VKLAFLFSLSLLEKKSQNRKENIWIGLTLFLVLWVSKYFWPFVLENKGKRFYMDAI
jgi:hypothetical protein